MSDVDRPRPGQPVPSVPAPVTRRVALRRYLFLVGAMVLTLGLLFAAVEALGVPILTDPSPWLDRGGWWAVAVGVGLLLVDVVLPVPSSVVMVANGAIFGVVLGSVLSLVGSTGAAMVGYLIGRRGSGLLRRVVSPDERARANRLLDRWGLLAIVVTRPIPLLAETMAIIAGTSRLGWRPVLGAVVVGAIPASLLYAVTGALASGFASGAIVFVVVLLVAGLFWAASDAIGRRFGTPTQPTATDEEH